MKVSFRSFVVRGIGDSAESGLNSMNVTSPGELLKTLALGLTATLLFSVGLYLCISGLVIALLALVL